MLKLFLFQTQLKITHEPNENSAHRMNFVE